MTSLDPRFAAEVRNNLVSTATGTSPLAVRTRRLRIGVGVTVGLAAASLLTAGALVVVGIPGDHIITDLGDQITVSGTGTQAVELGERPEGANAVSFVITCTSAGTFAADNGFMECADVDGVVTTEDDRLLAPIGNSATYSDLVLPGNATSFVVTASEGATWSVVAHYVKTVTTDWGVNANGQTYGTPNEKGVPDLIAAQATNGAIGYYYFTDLMPAGGDDRVAPYTIPVYESDGVTVIGQFPIGDS